MCTNAAARARCTGSGRSCRGTRCVSKQAKNNSRSRGSRKK